ncbi:MAG: hypothetical protein OGMRLDGQ_003074 [Candidatus Fervidibacter sp.]|jgi:hypothetical protein
MGVTVAMLSVLGQIMATTALLALAQFVSFARLAVGNASSASPTNQDTPLLVPLRMSGKKFLRTTKRGSSVAHAAPAAFVFACNLG